MVYHNPTCGCAECGNYGQRYNPHAIHNQSCGCAECNNYPTTTRSASRPQPVTTTVESSTASPPLPNTDATSIVHSMEVLIASVRDVAASKTKKDKAIAALKKCLSDPVVASLLGDDIDDLLVLLESEPAQQ